MYFLYATGNMSDTAPVAKISNDRDRFNMDDLLRAMAPTEQVMNAFVEDHITKATSSTSAWYSVESQQLFASIIQTHWSEDDLGIGANGPSQRYLGRLVKRYVSRVEEEINRDESRSLVALEDDNLMEWIVKYAHMSNLHLPDPRECCHVSFSVPPCPAVLPTMTPEIATRNTTSPRIKEEEELLLKIRVYPQHNDVGMRRVWEAGACLAEFLWQHPHLVSNQTVVELGAGVGLTGLVAAGACGAQHVHMTDYTPGCLKNLQHNIDINRKWLSTMLLSLKEPPQQQETKRKDSHFDRAHHAPRPPSTTVTSDYLEWEAYANGDEEDVVTTKSGSSVDYLKKAQVLLAADVIYDVTVLPCLAKTVRRFFTLGREKIAIFASTLRDESTLEALERELNQIGISCQYVESKEMLELPHIFPCYFLLQPRTDVRICIMTTTTTTAF